GNVMKLVEQHFAPGLLEVGVRVCSAEERADGCQLLSVQQYLFTLAIIIFRGRLTGKDAAVEFEIEFAVPDRQIKFREICFHVFEERAGRTEFQSWIDHII